MSTPWISMFLMLVGAFLCLADLNKYNSQENITCSEGLERCTVRNMNDVVPPSDFCPVEVISFDAEAAFCCKDTQMCKPCVRIHIHLRVLPDDAASAANDGYFSGETPDDNDDEDHEAAIKLCYVSPPNLPYCVHIRFFVKANTWKNQEKSQVVMVMVHDGIFLGSSVNVLVNVTSKVVDVPNYNAVCPSPAVEECKTPRITPEIDQYRGVVQLKTEDDELPLICVKKKGMGHCWSSNWTIPLHTVTHCMCFQAWRSIESTRSEICPFENHKEIRRNAMKNVSLSVKHTQTNEGLPALSWNLSAPCRLETEVWPCQMAVAIGGGCRELSGFRHHISTVWDENRSTAWTSDTFLDVKATNNLLPCVMFKVDGELFGPVCEHDTYRGRWIVLLLVMLMLFLLLVLGGIVVRYRLKEWLSNPNESRGLHGEVLLVHSSGSDPSLSDTVSWFATCLSELGFSVSLDLWNQVSVGSLGPTPWLHSRLQHVQAHKGRTLLLLSHDAVLRAKEWYKTWSSVFNSEDAKANNMWNSDIYSSALSSIFSARLKDSAAEHFALVQLESETHELPELFQGLRLYQLPSESQCLLTDLHTCHIGSFGARFKRFLWTWRASVMLERKLRNCQKEQRSRAESSLTQVESLSMEIEEEEEEMMPLQN